MFELSVFDVISLRKSMQLLVSKLHEPVIRGTLCSMFVDMYEVLRGCTDLLLFRLTWDFECVKENHIEAIAHKNSHTVVSWLSGLHGGWGVPDYWNLEHRGETPWYM